MPARIYTFPMRIIPMVYSIRYEKGCIGCDACEVANWSVAAALGLVIPPRRRGAAACDISNPQHFKIQEDGRAELLDGKKIKRNMFEKEIPESEVEMAKVAVIACPAGRISLAENGKVIRCKQGFEKKA